MTARLILLRPGPRTTMQDLGRSGRRAQGIPVAGALDPLGLRLANALAGNPAATAALELTLAGPLLEVAATSARLAVAGPARITRIDRDGRRTALTAGHSWCLGDGERLDIGAIDGATVAYLAVEGGFAIPPVLGSLSTHLGAAIGPLGGRALAAGPLPLVRAQASPGPERVARLPLPYGDGPIRVVPGPQEDRFRPEAMATLLSTTYHVGPRSDRMGMRLSGPPLPHRDGADIVSDGIVAGCIQVPGDGQPIILLADHQTTGGYAKIATVISADLPRLGRLPPGSALTFRAIAVAPAEQARRRQEQAMAAALAAIGPDGPAPVDLDALYRTNLISGMVADRGDDPPLL